MSRLFISASIIGAMLGMGRLAVSTSWGAEDESASYIEEATPAEVQPQATGVDELAIDEDAASNLAADDDASTDAASVEPASAADTTTPASARGSEAEFGEPDLVADEARAAVKINAEPQEQPELEIIRERYPNGAVKIERSVAQDATGNYVNEGVFRMWDSKGALSVEGNYHHGARDGVWNRWLRPADAEMLSKLPYNSFPGPFISQATFVNDKLDGHWTIYDARQRKISQFEYADGQRDGRMTWWFPNGRRMREAQYSEGDLDGQLIEWSIDGKVVTKETFQHGRRLAGHIDKDAAGNKKTEGVFLFAKEVEKTPDDWWNCRLATHIKQGKDEKHGPFITWYPRGQRQSEGEYRNDVQVGKFSWWYANGQKAIEGGYADGEQEGKWVWWHENGQKSIQGDYTKGHPSGRWTWWNEDGKIARSTEMESGAGEVVNVPEKPQARPPVRSGAKPGTLPGYRQVR